jgi:hypothetical protein
VTDDYLLVMVQFVGSNAVYPINCMEYGLVGWLGSLFISCLLLVFWIVVPCTPAGCHIPEPSTSHGHENLKS